MSEIIYSPSFHDDKYEYRHVTLPENHILLPRGRCMIESEWREIGIEQGRGWEHYGYHKPEPNVLLFRRLHGTDGQTGLFNEETYRTRIEAYNKDKLKYMRTS